MRIGLDTETLEMTLQAIREFTESRLPDSNSCTPARARST